MHRLPDPDDDLPSGAETLQSDAMIVPMLKAVERELAAEYCGRPQ